MGIFEDAIRRSTNDLTREITIGHAHQYATGGIYYGPLKPGDRVEIREGYDNAGAIGCYVAKANDNVSKVVVDFEGDFPKNIRPTRKTVLAEAIKAKPYTKRERAEKAAAEWMDQQSKLNHLCGLPHVHERQMRESLIELLERGI